MKRESSTVRRRVAFGCSLSAELVERLDAKRGQVPRSRFIEKVLTDGLSRR